MALKVRCKFEPQYPIVSRIGHVDDLVEESNPTGIPELLFATSLPSKGLELDASIAESVETVRPSIYHVNSAS